MNIEDILLKSTIGMDRKTFIRTAQLMRNPEGLEKPFRCPVCKKEIHKNEQNDLYCSAFNISYEKEGGCFWHRYADGLNYWSPPEDMFKVMAEKNEEFRKVYESSQSTMK